MKRVILFGFAVALLAVMSQVSLAQCTRKVENNQKEVELDKILCIVRESFEEYQKVDLGDESVKLKSATLSVSSTSSKKIGGGFSFWIISIGSSVKVFETSTLSITFKIREDNTKSNKISLDKLNDKIAQAIAFARQAIINSKKTASSSIVQLESEFSYEINFGVNVSATGEIEILIFKADAEISKEKTHTLKLNFGK